VKKKEAAWEAQLARLKVYRAEHGDCNVSTLWAEDKPLGSWVHNQRKLKKALDRGEPCSMTAARAAKLDVLGFKWELPTNRDAKTKAKDEQHIEGEPPMSGGGSAAGSEAQRAKPSAAAVSQLAQRGEPSWPAVGDDVEADWNGEGEWFDGRITHARADGTVRARLGRLSALSVLHRKSVLYGIFE